MNSQNLIHLIDLKINSLQDLKESLSKELDTTDLDIESFFLELCFPLDPDYLINLIGENIKIECPLAKQANKKTLELFIDNKGRQKGLKKIKDFVGDADELLIVDRYFLKIPNSQLSEIRAELEENFITPNIKKIKIVYDSNVAEEPKPAEETIKKICGENGVIIHFVDSQKVHDRVYIAKKQGQLEKGIVVGTSFKEIGSGRHSFILDLPREDLNNFYDILVNEHLV